MQKDVKFAIIETVKKYESHMNKSIEKETLKMKKEQEMTLDELLDSPDWDLLMNSLNHVPQMQKQNHNISLADTGRQPEHMYQ